MAVLNKPSTKLVDWLLEDLKLLSFIFLLVSTIYFTTKYYQYQQGSTPPQQQEQRIQNGT
jgi:hypothetical protein